MIAAILGALIRREVAAFLIGAVLSAYLTRKLTEREIEEAYKQAQMSCVGSLVNKYGLSPEEAKRYCTFNDVEFSLYKLATFGIIAGISGVAFYKMLSTIGQNKEEKEVENVATAE